MVWRHRWLIVVVTVAGACGDDGAARDHDAGADAGGVDSGRSCARDEDCDDDVFCNGTEVCAPGAGADSRGCTPGSAPECADATDCTVDGCSEEMRACVHRAPDVDGDSFGDRACIGDGGEMLGDDCDDSNAAINPGAAEICDPDGVDEDCDPSTFGTNDEDDDDAVSSACCNSFTSGDRRCGADCNDLIASVSRRASEVCNGRDDDCDTQVDEEVRVVFCYDADGDGHGDLAATGTGCSVPLGATTICNDCDDANPSRHPGAPELCRGEDADCDGVPDDGCSCAPVGSTRTCGATRGTCREGLQTCIAGVWESACSGGVAASVEACNGADDDCDGDVDEGWSLTFAPDCDADGSGSAVGAVSGCAAPAGAPPGCAGGAWATALGDCDDRDPAVRPGAGCDAPDAGPPDAGAPDAGAPGLDAGGCSAELCNGADDDCDMRVDEGFPCMLGAMSACTTSCGSGGMRTCTPACMFGACAPPLETCNDADDDCDARIDEGDPGGGAACGISTGACEPGVQRCVGGSLTCTGAVGPMPETCANMLDDDCDAAIDEGC